jgi:hypothetical protein
MPPQRRLRDRGREIGRTDATAGFFTAHKDAATNLIWPLIADQVKTVGEWADTVEGDKQGDEGHM